MAITLEELEQAAYAAVQATPGTASAWGYLTFYIRTGASEGEIRCVLAGAQRALDEQLEKYRIRFQTESAYPVALFETEEVTTLRTLAEATGRYLNDSAEASPEVRAELRKRMALAEEAAWDMLRPRRGIHDEPETSGPQ